MRKIMKIVVHISIFFIIMYRVDCQNSIDNEPIAANEKTTSQNNDNQNSSPNSSLTFNEKILFYYESTVDHIVIYTIAFHKFISDKLNIKYPYDLLVFALVGYLASYLLRIIFGKKVICIRLT